MDESKIKLQVLKGIMDHMRAKDGARVKPPKAVEIEVEKEEPEDELELNVEGKPGEMAEDESDGGNPMAPKGKGGDEDLSEEDLEKLKELYASLKE